LSDNSKAAFENSKRQLMKFFSGRILTDISSDVICEYRDLRRKQPLKNRADRTVKGATVNRGLETLQGLFKLAVQRSYIHADPSLNVEHLPETRERPAKRQISNEDYVRILESAPPYFRVGILLLEQAGNRTYSELFNLRWEQVDLDAGVISFNVQLKTEDSDTVHPLSDLAVKILRWWKERTVGGESVYFPKPKGSGSANPECKESVGEDSRRREGCALSHLSVEAHFLHSSKQGGFG
jgi:integrase